MITSERNAKIIARLEAYTRKITASPETARAALAAAGLTEETREAKAREELEAMRKVWAEYRPYVG